MTVSYFLKEPNNDITPLFARISINGKKFKFYLSENIEPQFWDKQKQRAKQTKRFPEYSELNSRLQNTEATINDIYRRYLNDNNGIHPRIEVFKDLLSKNLKKGLEAEQNYTFITFFEELIEKSKRGLRVHPKTSKPIHINTIKTYVTTKKHLIEFESYTKKKISFESIDLSFYEDYKKYLMKVLNLSNNSVGKHFQVIKLVMNEATETGINTNLAFKSKRFFVIRENADAIHLNPEEINELHKLDLSNNKKLEKTRDLFLIGCLTGLRYSDFSNIKKEQINNNYLHINQSKTNENVTVPIHPIVKQIINKHNGELPKAYSNQKTNEYLKEIGKKLDILHNKQKLTFTKGGKTISEYYSKYELVTSHTARRSFATNEVHKGIPTQIIMAITGHKTEKSFWKYVKLSKSDYAKLMFELWEKNQ